MNNNIEKRKFILSSELFSDFVYDISLYEVSNMDDILKKFKDELMNIFEKHNLTILKKKLDETELHIHGYSIEDILVSEPDSIFYVCDHS